MFLESVAALVLTSSPILKDALEKIGGPHIQVTNVVEGMKDPHHFDPSIKTLKDFKNAKLAVFVGQGFETWSQDLIQKTKFSGTAVQIVEKIKSPEGDPHVWMDPDLMVKVVQLIEEELKKIEPSRASDFSKNSSLFQKEIKKSAEQQAQRISSLSELRKRWVIESKSILPFCRYFNLDCLAISSKHHRSEISARELSDTKKSLNQNPRFGYLFEPHQSRGAAEQRARDLGIKAVGPFYVESLSSNSTGPKTYLDLIKMNVDLLLNVSP